MVLNLCVVLKGQRKLYEMNHWRAYLWVEQSILTYAVSLSNYYDDVLVQGGNESKHLEIILAPLSSTKQQRILWRSINGLWFCYYYFNHCHRLTRVFQRWNHFLWPGISRNTASSEMSDARTSLENLTIIQQNSKQVKLLISSIHSLFKCLEGTWECKDQAYIWI